VRHGDDPADAQAEVCAVHMHAHNNHSQCVSLGVVVVVLSVHRPVHEPSCMTLAAKGMQQGKGCLRVVPCAPVCGEEEVHPLQEVECLLSVCGGHGQAACVLLWHGQAAMSKGRAPASLCVYIPLTRLHKSVLGPQPFSAG